LGVGPSDLLIGVVGRLSPVKNFELALSGFAAFLKATRSPDGMEVPSEASMASGSPRRFLMVLVGDGPCRESLEKLARELGISDSVEFVGEKKDAWPYYAAMDIFMSTSHSEGMSQSILEAMASGKAIIATDVGDARQMLANGECGHILSESTPEELSTALDEIAVSELLRSRLGELAWDRFRACYRLESMLFRFDQLYRTHSANFEFEGRKLA
jgi:glycosyltransferase involved in cell wall biosynthesis